MKRHWQRGKEDGRRDEKVVEGVIQHHGHFAFMLSEKEGEGDVFLRGRGLGLAMDGDRVSARVTRERDGRLAGEIIKVVTRSKTSVAGILKKLPYGWVVAPEKGNAPPAKVTGFDKNISPKEGALALLEVTEWPTASRGAAGIVTELLGAQDDLRARITYILRSKGIVESFPKDVLSESVVLPDKLGPEHWKGREELFHLPIVTIDGADARDFDDAVSLEPLDSGVMRLGVHIADVSNYVKPGSALDKEAYARATSVYLPDRVVPMLPPSLSNNLCSLVPYQERLTISVFMDINPDGKVIKRRMANTVIKSCRRLTYDEAQAIIDGTKVADVPPAAAEAVIRMNSLSHILYKHRVKRGALDFNLPEYKVEVDADGKPVRVALRPRLASHRLIEEFMLLANESIATELMAAKAPFLHRRHDDPDPEKIKTLAKVLGELGFSAGHLTGGNLSKAIQDVLLQAEEHLLEGIVNSLIVRSMKQAVYSPESSGHFGIAAKAYAHFTSPIRRYPDLTAHRAIKALLAGKKENHDKLPLEAVGKHCSERERSAAEAEYKAIDIMRAELFKDRIGETMEGVVTSVIESGSFVMCADTGVEGMLRVTTLAPGTKVKVTVEAVNTIEGKIDLSLAQKPSEGLPAQWRITAKKPKHNKRQ